MKITKLLQFCFDMFIFLVHRTPIGKHHQIIVVKVCLIHLFKYLNLKIQWTTYKVKYKVRL